MLRLRHIPITLLPEVTELWDWHAYFAALERIASADHLKTVPFYRSPLDSAPEKLTITPVRFPR
jgi:hypothetical protein